MSEILRDARLKDEECTIFFSNFWSETSLGWFGGEWNGNVMLAIKYTHCSLPESNGTI